MNNFRGFPVSEFELRFKKIKDSMIQNSIEAILITTEANFHYFSGLNSQFWASPTRPMYLILATDKEAPFAVVPDIMLESMKNTFITELYAWSAPLLKDDGLSLLKKHLETYKTIGIPMHIETELRMPLQYLLNIIFGTVTEEFNLINSTEPLTAIHELVDVTNIIREQRIIKSPMEIRKIETACLIASDAFNLLPSHIEKLKLPHLTERRVTKEMHKLLLELGADSVNYIIGKSGRNGYSSVVDGPGDDILTPGDIFVIDCGAVFDNYYCDFDRNYVIKDRNNHSELDYIKENIILWEATQRGFEAATPGNTFGDVWKAMVDYMVDRGAPKDNYSSGRIGHCLGLELTELPSIVADEKTKLKPGMVITLEPFISSSNGIIVHEECVVITTTGARFLSKRAPKVPMNLLVNLNYQPLGVNIYNALTKKLSISNFTKNAITEFREKQPLCKKFHQTLGDVSPLINLEKMGSTLNIGELLIKDEGLRFGLKSFKGLGASFAISMMKETPKVLCTMTDGNHGKGVAFIAKKLNMKAIIYVPDNMTQARKDAITELGATVITVNGSYDDAIEEVKIRAKENNWCLVSDTAWESYEEIPKNIMSGYGTIFREIEEQRVNKKPITDVIIQAGVGGLAAAAAAWLECFKKENTIWDDKVRLIIVEPLDADCLAYNVMKQKNTPIKKTLLNCIGATNSIMAGLNCGMPSTVAYPIITDIAEYYVGIGDEWAKRAMRKLHSFGIISGESGAAGLAAVMATREHLFNSESVILVINTEADTDPVAYLDIINEKTEF